MADLPAPQSSAEEVRRIADTVLARPEFAEAQPSWWERFLRWFFDLIGRIFETIGGGGRGSVIGVLTVAVLALAAALAVVLYTRTVRRDPGMDLAMDTGIGRTERDWLAEAREHEAAGRWRDAVRCRYRALLAALAAAGLVDEVAGRTSGEYLAAVRTEVPDAAEGFADATSRFEVAWYGHGVTTAGDVQALSEAAARTAAAAGLRRSLVASDA